MLKKRIITSSILICTLVYIISFSPLEFYKPLLASLVAIIIFFFFFEYAALRWNIMDKRSDKNLHTPVFLPKHYLIGSGYALPVLFIYCMTELMHQTFEKSVLFCIGWIFLCLFISAGLIYRTAVDMHTASNKFLNVAAGFIYIGIPGFCIYHLSQIHFDGAARGAQIYFCLATTFMSDIGAYFIGVKFGKHKLIPRVSPKKSVEGAVAGLFSSTAASLITASIFSLPFMSWYIVAVGVLAGIAAQVGDLIESALKRAGGYKDSGHLLPGHGGVLDRIDSLLMSIPVIYIFFLFMIK